MACRARAWHAHLPPIWAPDTRRPSSAPPARRTSPGAGRGEGGSTLPSVCAPLGAHLWPHAARR